MNIKDFFDKLRKASLSRGYTCDSCGAEIFDYPEHRFCAACDGRMPTAKRTCPKCGRETLAEGVCLTCKSQTPKFTRGISAFPYKSEAAVAVNRMKNGNARLAAYFGEKMADRFLELCVEHGEEPYLILPVPLTESRRTERGYNQAERLAESFHNRLTEKGIAAELDFAVLEKCKETALQKEKRGKERTENAQGAYHLHKRKACENRKILLIDDILTTGATGSECARKLLNAGAKEVIFIVAAALPEKK